MKDAIPTLFLTGIMHGKVMPATPVTKVLEPSGHLRSSIWEAYTRCPSTINYYRCTAVMPTDFHAYCKICDAVLIKPQPQVLRMYAVATPIPGYVDNESVEELIGEHAMLVLQADGALIDEFLVSCDLCSLPPMTKYRNVAVRHA